MPSLSVGKASRCARAVSSPRPCSSHGVTDLPGQGSPFPPAGAFGKSLIFQKAEQIAAVLACRRFPSRG